MRLAVNFIRPQDSAFKAGWTILLMDVTAKMGLIRSVGEEIITEEDLKTLLETKAHPVAYDGFEPSGSLHIAQGVMRAINTNKLLRAGVKFKFWVADWFAWMNNKMGGDLDKIRKVGEYQIEVWKACGMDTGNVDFIWANEAMGRREYWKRVVEIARSNSVQRIIRCSQIMGRSEKDALSAAQIFYPCMQCSDIFELGADITNLGMDQRKVNVLAREVGPKLGLWKPVVVNYHMLMGLAAANAGIKDPIERKIAMKMSKSRPDTAIFMTDSAEEVERKIAKAYCPEKQVEDNPILEYCRYLIFEKSSSMKVERPAKFGGDLEFGSYAELESAFAGGKLHPMDLKNAATASINEMLEPVRKHFSKGEPRKLLEQVRSFEVTR
jgi:tyrosyl-tRNA synthetase